MTTTELSNWYVLRGNICGDVYDGSNHSYVFRNAPIVAYSAADHSVKTKRTLYTLGKMDRHFKVHNMTAALRTYETTASLPTVIAIDKKSES